MLCLGFTLVRGLRPRGKISPFSELDALYRHIFSQVRDLGSTPLILAWTLLTDSPSMHECTEFLEVQDVYVYVALASLQSIVDCTRDGHIPFLHASLPDFLFNSERSQEYCIWSTRFSVMAFKFVISIEVCLIYHMPAYLSLTLSHSTFSKIIFQRICTPVKQKLVLTYINSQGVQSNGAIQSHQTIKQGNETKRVPHNVVVVEIISQYVAHRELPRVQ